MGSLFETGHPLTFLCLQGAYSRWGFNACSRLGAYLNKYGTATLSALVN